MKSTFDLVSAKCSKITTNTYSTSFSLGILLLDSKIRNPIYSIYCFVRFADEIVDSFHDFNKTELLSDFKKETFKAIDNKISLNPILNCFQEVVNQFNIDHKLIHTFLKSMEMDLIKEEYNQTNYKEYILGSAEVVGLMCLKVFTNGNEIEYQKLKFSAQQLGSAFQKINFLRDAHSDYKLLGRTYFPNLNMKNFSNSDKHSIELEIEEEFKQALIGIKQLPSSSRLGVYVAYVYYLKLLKKIKKLPANRILEERIRVSNSYKIGLMINSLFKYKLNFL
jgi:phytoene/squalene synthetase